MVILRLNLCRGFHEGKNASHASRHNYDTWYLALHWLEIFPNFDILHILVQMLFLTFSTVKQLRHTLSCIRGDLGHSMRIILEKCKFLVQIFELDFLCCAIRPFSLTLDTVKHTLKSFRGRNNSHTWSQPSKATKWSQCHSLILFNSPPLASYILLAWILFKFWTGLVCPCSEIEGIRQETGH